MILLCHSSYYYTNGSKQNVLPNRDVPRRYPQRFAIRFNFHHMDPLAQPRHAKDAAVVCTVSKIIPFETIVSRVQLHCLYSDDQITHEINQ